MARAITGIIPAAGWITPATGSTWPASTGAYDKTTWTYDGPSGLLASKTDNSNHSVSYTYNSDLVHTRTWARGVTTTNTYTGFGDLTRLDYSDGTASVQFNDYNRSGLPRTIIDAAGTAVLTYDHADRLISTAFNDGLFAGVTLTNHFNGVHGREVLQIAGLATPITHHFRYEAFGRLGVVSNGVYSATYGYLASSDLLQTTTCKSNANTVLTTTRTWDYGVRLRGITNVANSVNVSSRTYGYDSLNRRIQAALEDGSAWNYDYNDRDELTGARRYWPDWSLVAGQQFAYDYDNIGNRRSASSGGDSSGSGLHSESYTANGLNQYTSRAVPGWVQTIGTANSSANVALSASGGACALASRKGEYFRAEVPVDNSAGAVWLTLTNLAALPGSPDIVAKDSGQLVLPQTHQTLTYDLDGNLTFDGVWTYEWDAENRLMAMAMTNVSGIPNAQRKRLEFAYDSHCRRVQKVVLTWDGSAFANPVTNLFVYDGWNLIAVISPEFSVLQSFTWGQDLSGTIEKAGGIGGLLLATCHSSPTTNCFVAYDGNGSVTALVNASDRNVAARYEFSPYGELLRANGPLATANPFRWSTKFWDEECGLVYYGYRYYSSSLGRWLGRDPAGEDGGIHLYLFLRNSPTGMFDPNGRTPQQLLWVGFIGATANFADTLFNYSSFMIKMGTAANYMQGWAAGLSVAVDTALGGRLLKNVGGPAIFAMYFAAGTAAGKILRFDRQQSLAAAVVVGRLSAVSEIGKAAALQARGLGPTPGDEMADAAYGFVLAARRGDSGYADLDAALLGAAIWNEQANYLGLGEGTVNALGMLADLAQGDAASAFSRLPSYQGLNAWDMATEMEDFLEGM